jgi:hypothetical protein
MMRCTRMSLLAPSLVQAAYSHPSCAQTYTLRVSNVACNTAMLCVVCCCGLRTRK